MKRVAIVTLQGYYNYGNRWQNYALQEIFKKYGYDVDSVIAVKRGRILWAKSLCRRIIGKAAGKRYFKIRKFSKKYIRERKLIYKDFAIPKHVCEQYDYFVTGSDQVWHPLVAEKERDYFFLTFVEQKKRICISPSFGVDEIPKQLLDDYQNGLNGFERLCAREKSGTKIIENITGCKAEWLIDPTMTLDKKEWEKIFPEKVQCPEKFLLLAMLGGMDETRREYIRKISETYNLEIVEVFNENMALGPDEVLFYLDHASLVVTDSFHFTAFSINFNRPFIVCPRQGSTYESTMFSRLADLLELFQMQERLEANVSEDSLLECDFSKANEILKQEREKFQMYLEECIGKKFLN